MKVWILQDPIKNIFVLKGTRKQAKIKAKEISLANLKRNFKDIDHQFLKDMAENFLLKEITVIDVSRLK